MQTKFQVNDKVFWFSDWDEGDGNNINISYVISIEDAKKYYYGYTYVEDKRKGRPSVEDIRDTSLKEYGCEPVFIVDELPSQYAGWIPENLLHLYTNTVKLLFEK